MLEMSIIYLTYLCILEFVRKDTYLSMVHVAHLVRTRLYFTARFPVVQVSSSQEQRKPPELWCFFLSFLC